MRIAFKEWAIVVDALGRAEQIVILRKGGISEGHGGFQVDHPQFLLFPTFFHQQRDAVVPYAQTRYDVIAPRFPGADKVRLEFFAEVIEWRQLDSLATAGRLRGQHIWRDEVIAQRFEWGKSKNIFVLWGRVFRCPGTIELPMSPHYSGCKSWVELEGDIEATGNAPALTDEGFGRKLSLFQAALETVETPTEASKLGTGARGTKSPISVRSFRTDAIRQ